jgi:hypothetical protein
MEMGSGYQTIGHGAAIIQAAGVAFTQVARGLSAAIGRTGAGVYTVPLLVPCPPTNALVRLTLENAAQFEGEATPDATGTVWTVSTFNAAGAAADVNFALTVEKLI